MHTLQDAREERLKADMEFDARMEQRRIDKLLQANPDIGVLMKDGQKVYYRFINGKAETVTL